MAKTDDKSRAIIPVINSINTDSVNEDIKVFGGDPSLTPHVQNTGIERDGGITNLYETETALPAGNSFVTNNGKTISLIANGDGTSKVTVDGQPAGVVSSYGLESNITLPANYADAVALGAQVTPALPNGGFMTLTFTSGIAMLTLFDTAGVQQATRSITFTALGGAR